MKALVDGDLILYRTGFAIEKTKYLVELKNPTGSTEFHRYYSKKEADTFIKNVSVGIVGVVSTIWSRKDLEPVEYGYQIINNTLNGLKERYGSDIEVFISGPFNFRDKLWTTKKYKGNRDAQVKPTHYEALKQYLIEKWGATVTDGIEADDAIGIASNSNTVCVSLDKDLDQIPGLHFDWVANEEYTVSPKEAKTQFYVQLLAGDPTDNIGGLSGVGPKKAVAALQDCGSPRDMMEVAVKMYKEEFGDTWHVYLLETAQLVYILRENGRFFYNSKDADYLNAILDKESDAQAA